MGNAYPKTKKDFLFYLFPISILLGLWTCFHRGNETQKLEDFYKKELSTYVDKDANDLSFEEHYQMRGLMGVQDSSFSYEPTPEDWKRGYDSMLVEKRMQKEAFWKDLEEKGLVEVINSQKDLHKK